MKHNMGLNRSQTSWIEQMNTYTNTMNVWPMWRDNQMFLNIKSNTIETYSVQSEYEQTIDMSSIHSTIDDSTVKILQNIN